MKKRDSNLLIGFASIVFLVVAAFGLGLLLGQGLGTARTLSAASENSAYNTDFLLNVYHELLANYLGDVPGGETITYGMAKGMVEALADKYSAFFDPEEAASYLDSGDSAFEGIGVQLGYDGQYTVVETPIEGYPGQEAGLLAGDIVLEVNGEDVTGVRPELVATKIRGQAGTTVGLKIFRTSIGQALDFTIERMRIDLDNVTYEQLANGVVVITIIKFTEGAQDGKDGAEVFNDQWNEIVSEVANLNPKGIILDLRSNPGGYVEAVKHVAEEFLPQNAIIMREQEKNAGSEEIFYDNRAGRLESIPLVVVVNEGSASASEILAAAIQDNARGVILGEKTVGKGVEQQLIDFSDGSLLLVTFRRWLTPNGVQIDQDHPIMPDQIVEYQPAGSDSGLDSQLSAALEIID